MRLQYPFLKKEAKPYSAKELLEILASEPSGHYLLGNHDFLHCGVHFTDRVEHEHAVKDSPVRAIADGTVVAYRINKNYPVAAVENPVKKMTEVYRYSTSFCLIKHEYEPAEEEKPIRHTPVAPATPQGWVNKNIVFERDVVARNPSAQTDQNAVLIVNIPSGSKATITAVSTDGYITVKMSYFAETIISYSGDLHKRDGKPVTVLNNKKPNAAPNDKELPIGGSIYFKAFEGNVMLGAGHGLFTEDIDTPSAASVPINNTTPAAHKLTFYSLYMHLLPYEAFGKDPNEGKTFVRSDIGNSTAGSNVNLDERKAASNAGGDNILTAGIPKGTVYELVSTQSTTADGFEFYQGYRVDAQGNRITPQQAVWFKYKKVGENRTYVVPHTFKSTEHKEQPLHWADGTDIECTVNASVDAVYTTTNNGKSVLATWGDLTAGSTFTYPLPSGLVPHPQNANEKLIQCTLKSGKIDTKNANAPQVGGTFYLEQKSLTNIQCKITPKTFDAVVPCAIPVKAGEVLGYLGAYETPAGRDGGVREKHQLHFEIFTCEEPAQLKKFLDNDAKIKTGRRFVRVDKDTEIIFAESPPVASSIASITAENRLTLSRLWVQPITDMIMCKDDQNQVWLGSKDFDANRTGWVKENAAGIQVLNQHELAELGFTPVEEKDGLATGYNRTGDVWGGSQDISEFFNAIYSKIKADGVITQQEIKDALQDPQVADQVRKIIPYHPSEWKTNNRLIETINEEIKKLEPLGNQCIAEGSSPFGLEETRQARAQHRINLLKAELEKIQKLMFWGEVDEVKDHDRVHFFHPIAFIYHLGPNVEKPIKIAIDAGHGGPGLTAGKRTPKLPLLHPKRPENFDISAGNIVYPWDFSNLGSEMVYEWEFNNMVATFVAEELTDYQGVEVFRVDDETGRKIDVALADRPDKARKEGANHYLAIHHNAAGNASSWFESHYIVVLIHRNTDNGKHVCRRAAQLAADGIAGNDAMGIRKRPDGNGVNLCGYQVLREFNVKEGEVAIYIEAGFMDSKRDIFHMIDDNYKFDIKRLRGQAKAIARAYVEVLGLVKP